MHTAVLIIRCLYIEKYFHVWLEDGVIWIKYKESVYKYWESISTYINSEMVVFLQNYNTAAKPFGSPAPRPDVEAVTQQTSQLNFSP